MSVDTKRFASNLMEMALGENKVELYFRQLKLVNDGLNRNEELRQFIDDIQYSPTDKVEKLRETFGSALNDNVINTFFLVNNTLNRRHTELVLLHDFLELYYESKGMLFGEVRSVRVLDEETLNKLEKAILKSIAYNGTSTGALADLLQAPIGTLLASLNKLELCGFIRRLPNSLWIPRTISWLPRANLPPRAAT